MNNAVWPWPAASARFFASVHSLSEQPDSRRREIAILGRSNSGKSSLLNALVGVRGLAKTSKTPGRTRALNFFALSEKFALVDLPGYGYAKLPQAEARVLSQLLYDYLRTGRNLAGAVMVVDARRAPQAEEIELARLIRERNLELILAINKCDKLARHERSCALKRHAVLAARSVLCSALKGQGIDELRRELGRLLRVGQENLKNNR